MTLTNFLLLVIALPNLVAIVLLILVGALSAIVAVVVYVRRKLGGSAP